MPELITSSDLARAFTCCQTRCQACEDPTCCAQDLYFKRHDGSAVTCEDFLRAMADANNEDLSSLSR